MSPILVLPEVIPAAPGTSAGGSVPPPPAARMRYEVLAWGLPSLTATIGQEAPPLVPADLTAAHLAYAIITAWAVPAETAVLVRELRERSGLTWGELARLLGVSRRSVHNWADGGRMSSGREHRLREIAAIVDDLPSDPTLAASALRRRSGERPIIDIAGMGAPASLIRAHLAEQVALRAASPPPRRGARGQHPARPPDPRRVRPRDMLAPGALPPQPQGRDDPRR